MPAGDYEIKLYKYESKAGGSYYNGEIKPKFKKQEARKPEVKASVKEEDDFLSGDCPF